MSQLLMADRPLVARAGRHTVQLSITDGGTYRVEVLTSGPVPFTVDELTRAFEDERLARTVAWIITLALRKDDATVETAQEAVAQFLNAQPVFDSEPVGLKAIACLADVRQVRGTMAGAQHVPPSEPLKRILTRAATLGGTVPRSKTANVRQLRALCRKGLVDLTYRPGSSRPDVVSATLTARGWRQAVTA